MSEVREGIDAIDLLRVQSAEPGGDVLEPCIQVFQCLKAHRQGPGYGLSWTTVPSGRVENSMAPSFKSSVETSTS